MAGRCLGELVRKMGDRVLRIILPTLRKSMSSYETGWPASSNRDINLQMIQEFPIEAFDDRLRHDPFVDLSHVPSFRSSVLRSTYRLLSIRDAAMMDKTKLS